MTWNRRRLVAFGGHRAPFGNTAPAGGGLPISTQLEIGFGGQSNMTGGTTSAYATPALTTAQPFSNTRWNGSSLIPLVEPAGANNNESPVSACANWIAAQEQTPSPGRIVNAHNWAVPGASITTLRSGTSAYNAAVSAMGQISTALGGAVSKKHVAIWCHGEANDNVSGGFTATDYATEMVNLQAAWESSMRASAGAVGSVPLILAQMGNWPQNGATTAPYRTAVGQGQWFAARDNPGRISLACPTYQLPFQNNGGNNHQTNVGQRRMGEYLAKAARYEAVLGQVWQPLHIAQATALGPAITVQFAGGDGSSLAVDTTQMIARHTRGFEYTDGTAQPAGIVSVAIDGPNRRATLTLNKDAASSGIIRYGLTSPVGAMIGGAPTGTPVGIGNGGNVRDSDSTPSRSAGEPALQNWAIAEEHALNSFTAQGAVPPVYANTQSIRLGATDFLQIAELDDLNGAAQVTWAWRVRRDTAWVQSGQLPMLIKLLTGHFLYDFRGTTSGRAIFYIADSATTTRALTTASGLFAGNTWITFVVVFNGLLSGDARLGAYANGSDLVAGGSYSGAAAFPAALRTGPRCATVIGASTNDTGHFGPCNFRDVAMWLSAASAAQAVELHAGGVPFDWATSTLGVPLHYYRGESDFCDYGSAPRHVVGFRAAGLNSTHP